MKKILLFALLCITMASCGPQIYQASNFKEVKDTHKTVAVLPFDVTIEQRKLLKGVTVEMIQDQQKDYGYGIQSDVYGYFLREMSKNKYTVNFQDVSKTNALLNDAGISYDQMRLAAGTRRPRRLQPREVLAGLASALVLFGYAWWAPLVLAGYFELGIALVLLGLAAADVVVPVHHLPLQVGRDPARHQRVGDDPVALPALGERRASTLGRSRP